MKPTALLAVLAATIAAAAMPVAPPIKISFDTVLDTPDDIIKEVPPVEARSVLLSPDEMNPLPQNGKFHYGLV